jgi:DNA adenine methylase
MSRHGTPLRYPGGKQKLTPFIREILSFNELANAHYIEPYAGGAGVAVELLLSGDVAKIHLNDSCSKIHAIWWSILNEPEAFCRKIRNASLTVDEWRRQQAILRAGDTTERLQLGFSAFYLNRVNRSGILTGGLIGGLKQTGTWNMDARFPRNELIRRIELIASRKKKIAIRNWDAEKFISEYLPRLGDSSLVYFDPPYYRKAERLYLNHYSPADHARLAEAIQGGVSLPWLVSYDGAAEIQELYGDRRSFLYSLQYNAARCYQGSEFFAFSDKLKIPNHSSLSFIQQGLASMK